MSASGIPVRALAREAGRQPAYYEHARSYDRDTGVFQPYRQAVAEALPLQPGQVVLDVGCGTGLCCGLLRDKVGPDGTVIGIEESPEMAALAREHITREGWRNVTVVQSPAEDARFEGTADAALFCAVHDILQSPGALRNVVAGLCPGAPVAAGGGKWAAPLLVAVNSMIRALHALQPLGGDTVAAGAARAVRAGLRRLRPALAVPGAARRGRSGPGDGVRRRVRDDRPHASLTSSPGTASQSARIFTTSTGKIR